MLNKYLFYLVEKYSKPEFLFSDPIQFCYRYESVRDIELVAIITSLFSYGNVNSICKFLESIFSILGKTPSKSILEISNTSLNSINLYRFQKREDVFEFLIVLSQLWKKEKSFQNYFLSYNLNLGILNFQKEFWKLYKEIFSKSPSYGLQFLVGKENEKSTHKRYWMFLRWMIRKTFPDFGIYHKIHPKDLIYPLDTHILQFSELHKITLRKTNDYKKALEITQWFQKFSEEDPLIFDFPITRIGILRRLKKESFKI